ncbi:MAG: SDR family NAD(P)-dependent oxidoreductase [Paludibacteraceae bacterium]|nr:SDR family NAD(P)-dependent oxidoreductase [Paludibacteraceae bacterium]
MSSKIVFITGATSGIGAACAHTFASHGYNLILNARKAVALEELRLHLQTKYNIAVHTLCFDVRNRKAAKEAISSLPSEFASIDILINNAGLALGIDKEYEGNEEDYDTMIDTNITALLMLTRMIVPQMVQRGRGHIINIGSVAGDAAYPGGSVYCATKAAVKILSDGLRIDLVDTPLRVTNIKPGLVETNFSITRFGGDTTRASKVYEGIQPLRGEDIADVVYYAASAPAHVQIAEVLVLATNQANGSIIHRQ